MKSARSDLRAENVGVSLSLLFSPYKRRNNSLEVLKRGSGGISVDGADAAANVSKFRLSSGKQSACGLFFCWKSFRSLLGVRRALGFDAFAVAVANVVDTSGGVVVCLNDVSLNSELGSIDVDTNEWSARVTDTKDSL